MDSTDDKRTENNTVSHQYRILTEAEKVQVKTVKDMGLTLLEYVNSLGQTRELSLARTKIEEAVMWAVKHITK